MTTLHIETPVSDEELLREVVEDTSTKALEQIYHRHRGLLKGIIMRVVHDDSLLDDVLQDVFVQVWTHASTYRPEKGPVLGWLITMARRRAVDRLRQRYAYEHATNRFGNEHERHLEDCDGNCLVDQDVCANDLRCLMFTLISTLPPAQQEVIVLTYFNELSQREIASHLALPLGTVKTRMELGMRKLVTAMAPIRDKVV